MLCSITSRLILCGGSLSSRTTPTAVHGPCRDGNGSPPGSATNACSSRLLSDLNMNRRMAILLSGDCRSRKRVTSMVYGHFPTKLPPKSCTRPDHRHSSRQTRVRGRSAWANSLALGSRWAQSDSWTPRCWTTRSASSFSPVLLLSFWRSWSGDAPTGWPFIPDRLARRLCRRRTAS